MGLGVRYPHEWAFCSKRVREEGLGEPDTPWGVTLDRRPTGPRVWTLHKKGLAQHLNKLFPREGWTLSWDFNIHISIFQMYIILRSDNKMTENVQKPHALSTFQIVTHLPVANLWGRNPTLPHLTWETEHRAVLGRAEIWLWDLAP